MLTAGACSLYGVPEDYIRARHRMSQYPLSNDFALGLVHFLQESGGISEIGDPGSPPKT